MATLTRTILLMALLMAPPAHAGDVEDLTAMLRDFLATVDERDTHERFWAEDLIYTSSSGTRFDKAAIMSGFEGAQGTAGEPEVVYSADDIQINVYGDAAVVAFKLVATPADGSAEQFYLNTGTFLRRDGRWQAVAWQATRVPDAD